MPRAGDILAYLQEIFPPKSTFSVDDIPDLTGRVIIVTGANRGVGRETAKALLLHNARVYLACLSQEAGEKTIAELKEETGKEGLFLKLDLANLKSVKSAAEEFLSKERQLHVLFNNAGVMTPPIDHTTADGIDLQFGTNVLGHFYFTSLLLPILLFTGKRNDSKARVIWTSSSIQMLADPIDYNTIKDGPARRRKSPEFLYGQSKLGVVCMSNEFARRYGDAGLVSVSLNPGNMISYLHDRPLGWLERKIISLLLYPTPDGALTQLWAGTTAEGETMNGKYLKPWARYGRPNPIAEDNKATQELWKWCEDQVANI